MATPVAGERHRYQPRSQAAPRTVWVVIDDAELAAAVAGRAHWQLDELGAQHTPPGAAAYVRIRPIRSPTRARDRYVVSVTEGPSARQATPMPTAATAVAWAERRNLA